MPQVSDPAEWDIEELLQSLRCDTCLDEVFNTWLVCLRRFSMLNLHPEYISRTRQYWFVAMLPLKYLILPQDYTDFLFSFNGLLLPKLRTRTLSDPLLPKFKRKADFITYGKHLLCNRLAQGKTASNNSFSGNELLVDKTGLTSGTCIIYNSGCMTTSNGPNAGRSKAIPLAYALYGFDVPYVLDLNFGPAWTTLDMRHISAARIPIVMRLAQVVEDKFWVSFHS